MKLHRHLIAQIVEALVDVFASGYYVDKVIERRFKAHPKWGARDRRQFAEAVYEIVRWWRWHWCLAGLPDAQCLQREHITPANCWLVWGAFFIQKTGVSPEFPETDSLDVETVLERKELRVAPAIRAAIPDWLNDLARREVGDSWPDMLRALNRPAEVYLRTNTLKLQAKPLSINLEKEDIPTKLVSDTPDALQLTDRRNVFASSGFRAGLFEVQDAGSQHVAPFLDVKSSHRVIDACAGAGGKSLHLACLMKNKGKIIAMDIHQWKLDELRKRATRNGIDIIETRVIDDAKSIKRLHETADRVLLDVPCSGLGVLRRNPDAKWKLSLAELDRLRVLQAQLLEDYSRMVKPGGKLVYATCSILPSENELQVQAFLKAHGDDWTLEEQEHLLPQKHGYDGFYAARLVKKAKAPPVKVEPVPEVLS